MLVDAISASPGRVSDHDPYLFEYENYFAFPITRLLQSGKEKFDARALVIRAFLRLPETGFVPLVSFLDYEARANNPFLDSAVRAKAERLVVSFVGRGDPGKQFRDEWYRVLEYFLGARLVPFGGVRLGYAPDRRLCFALTAVGRYLLGVAKDFAYGEDETGEIIVQPNYEIVFLSPSPVVEAELGRFSERVGRAPGVVFRLTRQSVLGASHTGATSAEVLAVLRRVSSRPIPPNVEREITGWIGLVRRAAMSQRMVIESPDAETAARVLGSFGGDARALNATMVDVTSVKPAARQRVLKKLRGSGVFVEEERQEAPPKRAKSRLTASEWDDEDDDAEQ
jgi:hypothetical protein